MPSTKGELVNDAGKPACVVEHIPVGTAVEQSHVTDPVDLFLFSAACWLAHRVHFDSAFARAEGLADTPVQGPLQGSWLSQLVDDWARQYGGDLVQLTFRNVRPAYPGDQLTARAVVASVDPSGVWCKVRLSLSLSRADGEETARGTAIARFPSTA